MKKPFFVVLIAFLTNFAVAQSPLEIVNEFKKGNMSFVTKCSTVPFTIQYVNTKSDTCLRKNLDVLEERLIQVLDVITLDEMNRSEMIKNTETRIILVFKSYNKEGELESESSLRFDFMRAKRSKKMKLYQISLAG
ncbi:MAG: hypothetical protein ABI729_03545 [Chitinophagales bacterium]